MTRIQYRTSPMMGVESGPQHLKLKEVTPGSWMPMPWRAGEKYPWT